MKGGKQQKNKSIWDQVKNEERDFYYNYLAKKFRGIQKKLKDISQLEELQKTKELKPEQIQKIQTKDENNEKVKQLEAQLAQWWSAKQESEKTGLQIPQEAFILILEHLSENPATVALLTQDNESLHELSKDLQAKIQGQLKKKDQPWVGLKFEQTQQSENKQQQVQEVKQEEPEAQEEEQAQLQQPEHTETHQEQVQQDHYVLTKSTPKKAVQEETHVQPLEQLPQQQEQVQKEQQEQPQSEFHQQEQQVEQQQNQQVENQDQQPQTREGHRHDDNQRRGYKKHYNNNNNNNYERRNNGERPYRGNKPYNRDNNRDRQQRQEWEEKVEGSHPQHEQHQQQPKTDADEEEGFITVGYKQQRQQQPQRGGNRNYDNRNKGPRNQKRDQEVFVAK